MSDGQTTPENIAGSYYDASSVPDLQEAQDTVNPDAASYYQENVNTEEPSIREMINGVLQNQAIILNNQAVMDSKLNSIGQILDYMGQTVQGVAKTFQSGGGIQSLMGMLSGGKSNG